MGAASTLRASHRAATFRTLFGLLVVTGMRIGEALALDRSDFDADFGVLIIRHGKFGKSRELPLHPSTTSAVTRYLRRRGRPQPAGPTDALLLSGAGTRLLVGDVQSTFRRLRARAGILPRSAACRPRLHDIRHSFAVRTLLALATSLQAWFTGRAFVVVAVLRDDRGKAAQIVPEQYPAWPCLPFRKRGEQASESVAASRF